MRTVVTTNNSNQRLDIFVAKKYPFLSRSSIRRLIDDNKITVNTSFVKASHKLRVKDIVEIDYDIKKMSQIPQISIPIIYEDDDCIVLNKPGGVLTHSKGNFNPEATVATFISHKLKDMTGERAGIVHRLDRATSGIIINAKNDLAMKWLQKQFSQRKVKKTYYAVIAGKLEPAEALIEIPIERNSRDPKSFRPAQSGKPALTYYKVIKQNASYSLLKLEPTTGRTHQLRVHLKYLGHPIVGDTLYGGETAKRLFLHAEKLEITLLNRQRKVFTATLPAEFNAIIKQ